LLLLLLLCSFAQSEPPGEQEMVNPWVEMFGEKLYAWNEARDGVVEVNTEKSLSKAGVVAIYFSSSWCGPCRQFTPQLASFYESMKKKGKKFEIVWVSGDRSSDDFLTYYSKMPWLAVPLAIAQRVSAKLGPRFKLKGIPHLVVLDGVDASVYTLDGRTKVSQDRYGLEFPWRPRSLMNLLPRPVVRLLKQQIEHLRASLTKLLAGLLDSLAPRKVLALLVEKIQAALQKTQPIRAGADTGTGGVAGVDGHRRAAVGAL